MNFGRKGVQDKLDELESSSGLIGNWAGVSFFRISLLAIIGLAVLVFCLFFGIYKGILSNTPDISEVNIMPNGYATFVYDCDGNQIQKLNSAEGNRESVGIESIPLDMQHAIVAIEDSRFYKHNGVDPIGMIRAAAVAVSTGFSRTEGASTITQQLLKNNVFTDWTTEGRIQSIVRKIQEQQLAVELEASLTQAGYDAKSVILENYLNTVNFGSGAYGIQSAAKTYFGKNCSELTLSECAVLAAIPQNPTKWNPRNHPDFNAERRATVLSYMLEQGYITEDAYNEALADTTVYDRIAEQSEKTSVVTPYSYFIDEVISQVKQDLMDELGYTEVQAVNAVYSGGLRIYTTQDSNIQSIMEEEFANDENFPGELTVALDWALTVDTEDGERINYSREMMQKYYRQFDPDFDLLFSSAEEAQTFVDQYKAYVVGPNDTIVAERISFSNQPEACMTIIDQTTGYVKGIVGGRGTKSASLTLNRATDSYRQPGSTFKILSTYGPALEMNTITLATKVDDEEYNYSDGTPVHNSDDTYHGNVSIREAITYSYNVVAVKILTAITPQAGFDYLMRMGFTQLIDDTNWDVIQPLALGGVTNGVSNLELCAAYAMIANGGTYIEPTFYTKVTDQNGNVLLDKTPETHTVFHASTAYLLTSAMMDVVSNGTGMEFAIDGMTLAGKTGTTTSYRDLVFAGFTPYYTAAIWAGSDVSVELPEEYRNFHKTLWTKIMTRIHEGLENKTFEAPETVQSALICSVSGLLAGKGCPTTTEYFSTTNMPTTRCKAHEPTPTPTPKPTATPTPTGSVTPTPSTSVTPTEIPTSDPEDESGDTDDEDEDEDDEADDDYE